MDELRVKSSLLEPALQNREKGEVIEAAFLEEEETESSDN